MDSGEYFEVCLNCNKLTHIDYLIKGVCLECLEDYKNNLVKSDELMRDKNGYYSF